jgi:undecaprenyl-diphosphatase
MTWWQALLLGVLQGVTEFLPVSSSGHLVLAQDWLGFPSASQPKGAALFFDGVLHLGTLVSVLLYFRRELKHPAPPADAATSAARPWPATRQETLRLAGLLALAALPSALAVVFLSNQIKESFEQPVPVAWNFIILGAILFLTDRFPRGTIDGPRMSWPHALVIGVAQSCSAVFRGLSRSGMTVSGALLVRLDRAWAVRFSFMMSMVASLGLGGFGILEALRDPAAAEWLTAGFLGLTLLGTITSAVVGYLTMQPLLRIVRSARLWWFTLYLWLIAAVVLVRHMGLL